MMLRASSQATDREFDLQALVGEAPPSGSGVPHGELLLRFTDAVVARDETQVAAARREIRDVMGDRALVDTAGVVANFHRMTRIADGTGIPLDEMPLSLTEELREELGVNRYSSAQNSLGVSP